jgi:Txe/YoeB family toxin of toxin-antitoxin system
VVKWELIYTRDARKDAQKLAASGLKTKAEQLLKILENDPWQSPPRLKSWSAIWPGAYSRRINIQHRLVYEVLKNEKIVKVIRMWTHYE